MHLRIRPWPRAKPLLLALSVGMTVAIAGCGGGGSSLPDQARLWCFQNVEKVAATYLAMDIGQDVGFEFKETQGRNMTTDEATVSTTAFFFGSDLEKTLALESMEDDTPKSFAKLCNAAFDSR
jgi:hypothetical protein